MRRQLGFQGSVSYIWLFMVGVFIFVFMAVYSGNAWAKVYNIKFETVWNSEHPEYKAILKFTKMVEKATHGQVKFTMFPAAQLVPLKQGLSGLKNGVLDMLAGCSVYYQGLVPEGAVDWMPFVAAGHRSQFWKFINSGKMHDIIYNAYLKKANAVWLTDVLCGSEGIIGRDHKVFRRISQLKGIKLRAAGGLSTRTAEALGASPVTIDTGELYPALQRGTIDAAIFPEYGLKDYQLYEVAKTYTKPGLYIWCDDLWINKNTWNSLPKNLRDTIQKVAHKWAYWASTVYWPKYEEEINKWVKEKGVIVVHLPKSEIRKAMKLVQPVWNWYASTNENTKEEVKLLRAEVKSWKKK